MISVIEAELLSVITNSIKNFILANVAHDISIFQKGFQINYPEGVFSRIDFS